MMNLLNAKKVKIKNFSRYEEGKSNDGGCYGFWTNYDRLENGNWEVSYGTTADMEFCSCCGRFEDHWDGEDYSCGESDQISTEELLEILRDAEERAETEEGVSIELS
jgi:hypothetical protein